MKDRAMVNVCCSSWAPSLKRERVCNLYAICQWLESKRTHNHILLSHLRVLSFETQLYSFVLTSQETPSLRVQEVNAICRFVKMVIQSPSHLSFLDVWSVRNKESVNNIWIPAAHDSLELISLARRFDLASSYLLLTVLRKEHLTNTWVREKWYSTELNLPDWG
jgi:hypothetical protein